MFTPQQIRQLDEKGISLEQAGSQLEIFKRGIEPVKLDRPAIPGDGIEICDQVKTEYYVNLFQKDKYKFSFIKFVPASGAASRMFKSLFEVLNDLLLAPAQFNLILDKSPQIKEFFSDLNNYPFYLDLVKMCKSKDTDPESLIKQGKYAELLSLFLSGDGLAYGELPKGLLKFHVYETESRTAFEEHFSEAGLYLSNEDNIVKIHFTVSPEHLLLFQNLTKDLVKKFLNRNNISFKVEFSVQKLSTDTLAVDLNNEPFVLENEKLLFRPGGHGALLNNMQEIRENIIFVGNIDNVAPDRTKAMRVRYKELLGGILLERIHKIHDYLNKIPKGITETMKNEILDFIRIYISDSEYTTLKNISERDFDQCIIRILNRPVRVCGMVKNIGEPGGGPFWITDKSGNTSKQIVESSQVNLNDPHQNNIFLKATHFNPVDMVCFINDFKGNRFKLEDFRDPEMAFIAIKSQGSQTVKALELPGLWNGSMAGWLTFFVDVPVETFSPVKTIFDLRREEHIV